MSAEQSHDGFQGTLPAGGPTAMQIELMRIVDDADAPILDVERLATIAIRCDDDALTQPQQLESFCDATTEKLCDEWMKFVKTDSDERCLLVVFQVREKTVRIQPLGIWLEFWHLPLCKGIRDWHNHQPTTTDDDGLAHLKRIAYFSTLIYQLEDLGMLHDRSFQLHFGKGWEAMKTNDTSQHKAGTLMPIALRIERD